MNTSRDLWVDYAKAIGIILVVYGHVARGLYNASIPMGESTYKLIDSFIYSFHMPLFFFLSGLYFVKSLSNRSTKTFLLSKVDTIVYPYLLWSLIQGCIEATLSSQTNGSVTYSEVFAMLWQPRAQFWFLYALALIFIFTLVLYRFLNLTKTHILLFISIILFLFKGYLPFIIYTNFIFSYFIYFALGMFLQHYNSKKKLDKKLMIFTITLMFLLTQYLTLFHFELIINIKIIADLITATSAIGFVIVLSKSITKYNLTFLQNIGKFSMAIYLLHILTGSSIRIILQKAFHINSFSLHLIIGVLAGILLPMLVVYISKKIKLPFIDKYPISKYFQ